MAIPASLSAINPFAATSKSVSHALVGVKSGNGNGCLADTCDIKTKGGAGGGNGDPAVSILDTCRDGGVYCEDCEERTRRWGLGVFFDEETGVGGGAGYPNPCLGYLEDGGGGGSGESFGAGELDVRSACCKRDCYSVMAFRPRSANLGYRTRSAYQQGFGSERLGQIFDCYGKSAMGAAERTAAECAEALKTTAGVSTDAGTYRAETDVVDASVYETAPRATSGGKSVTDHPRAGLKSVTYQIDSAPSLAQKAASAAAQAAVMAAMSRDPTLDTTAQRRVYASEFFSENPCLAFLPWQDENGERKKTKKKKKKKKKKVGEDGYGSSGHDDGNECKDGDTDPRRHKKKEKKKKGKMRNASPQTERCCKCETQVNTVPMSNTKFTQTDWPSHDQYTWTDNFTSDKCEGTELPTHDQFTNVRPEDIDPPPTPTPRYSGRHSRRQSRNPSRAVSIEELRRSVAESFAASRRSTAANSRVPSLAPSRRVSLVLKTPQSPAKENEGTPTLKWAAHSMHSLVNLHPSAESQVYGAARGVSVPQSFATIGMGQAEQQQQQQQLGAPPQDEDADWPPDPSSAVYSPACLSCCPPSVGDPCELGRLWRRTPKYCDVVRAPPLCDCCLTRAEVCGGKSVI